VADGVAANRDALLSDLLVPIGGPGATLDFTALADGRAPTPLEGGERQAAAAAYARHATHVRSVARCASDAWSLWELCEADDGGETPSASPPSACAVTSAIERIANAVAAPRALCERPPPVI
jgi:hypothetical protein